MTQDTIQSSSVNQAVNQAPERDASLNKSTPSPPDCSLVKGESESTSGYKIRAMKLATGSGDVKTTKGKCHLLFQISIVTFLSK